MNMLSRMAVLTLLPSALMAEVPVNDKSFICLTENAVAFVFNSESERWIETSVPGDKFKFLVRPTKANDLSPEGMPILVPTQYGVWMIGEEHVLPAATCKEGISEVGWLKCGVEFNQPFVMNYHTKRFMFTNHGDYLRASSIPVLDGDGGYQSDENGDLLYRPKKDSELMPPFMAIGSCTELQ